MMGLAPEAMHTYDPIAAPAELKGCIYCILSEAAALIFNHDQLSDLL